MTVSAVSEIDVWCIMVSGGREGSDGVVVDDEDEDDDDDDDDDDDEAAFSDVNRDAADEGRICTANIPPKEEEADDEKEDDDDEDDEEEDDADEECDDGDASRMRPPVVADAARR